ncbi:hypothetical protein FUAX_50780 (plasmid) [Fulvitalea axinellae]|uniref:Transporter n=1 Tax=Fulvitalea axinellae TaxID=1182444 RepID=A0AAU9CUF5_9BACT|nr:hypothetical protein FUAX_50780 [Fulvitalea axinellae]
MNKLTVKIWLSILLLLNTTVLTAQSVDDESKAAKQANNPLANMKAFNIQTYYAPTLSGVDGATATNSYLRYAQPIGRVLVRATMPISTINLPGQEADAGLGDLNIFATYLLTDPTSGFQLGIGPQVTLPTGTGDFGKDTWNLGGALVAFNGNSARMQWGGLVTYDTLSRTTNTTPLPTK